MEIHYLDSTLILFLQLVITNLDTCLIIIHDTYLNRNAILITTNELVCWGQPVKRLPWARGVVRRSLRKS